MKYIGEGVLLLCSSNILYSSNTTLRGTVSVQALEIAKNLISDFQILFETRSPRIRITEISVQSRAETEIVHRTLFFLLLELKPVYSWWEFSSFPTFPGRWVVEEKN